MVVGVAYAIYSQAVVPLMLGTGPSYKAPTPPQLARPEIFDPAEYFPEDRWERGKCKILKTQHGYVLFKDYFPKDDGTVDVEPVTFIFGTKSKKGHPAANDHVPMILQAPKAELTFDQRMSISGGIGKFQKGKLIGDITIRRVSDKLDLKQQFIVKTKDIFLTKSQILTRSNVDFQFGPHRGSGRNLLIDLDMGDGPKKDYAKSKVTEIRLENLHQFVIDNRPSDLDTGSSDFESTRFKVTCSGPLVYSVSEEVATLNDQVRVARLDGFRDQLDCARLRLHFQSATSQLAPKNQSKTNLKIHKVVALGSPASINMVSRKSYLQANQIEYDFLTATAELSGKQVLLKQEETQFVGASLKYTNNDDGSLGKVLALGPGQVTRTRIDEQRIKKVDFVANFDDKLTVQPHSNRKVISLYGKPSIVLSDQSKLDASELHFWLWEKSRLTPEQPNGGKSPRWTLSPSQLVAKGNVALNSRQLVGTTRHLIAKWEQSERSTLGSNGRFETHVVAKPVTQIQESSMQLQPSSNRPTYFVGDEVEIELAPHRQASNKTEKQTLGNFNFAAIRGNVLISDKPIQTNAVNTDATRIMGDKVVVTPTKTSSPTEKKYRVEITAQKHATLQSKNLSLHGSPILYDQMGGRAWIQGAGYLTASITQKSGLNSADNFIQPEKKVQQKPKRPTDVFIRWNGGMVFDGSQAYFENVVESEIKRTNPVEKTVTITKGFAKAMTLVLKSEINLAQPSANSNKKPEADRLILVSQLADNQIVFGKFWSKTQTRKNVLIEHQVVLQKNNQVQSIQKVKVPSAILVASTSDMTASGPGRIQIWQQNRASKTPFQSASTSNTTPGLIFTQVNFERSMIGNAAERKVELRGNIKGVYSPVESFQQTIALESNILPTTDAIHLTCSQMDINQWKSQNQAKPHLELVCSGQTKINGQLFKAAGDRVRYNQLGEKLIIEGGAPSYAQLEYRKNFQSATANATAEKLTYFIKSRTYQAENVKQSRATFRGKIGNR